MTRTREAEQYATPTPGAQPLVTFERALQQPQTVTATGGPAGAVAGAVRSATQYAGAFEELADR